MKKQNNFALGIMLFLLSGMIVYAGSQFSNIKTDTFQSDIFVENEEMDGDHEEDFDPEFHEDFNDEDFNDEDFNNEDFNNQDFNDDFSEDKFFENENNENNAPNMDFQEENMDQVPAKDLAKEKKMMMQNLRGYNAKEWQQIEKRAERLIKKFENSLGKISKIGTQDSEATAEIAVSIKTLQDLQSESQKTGKALESEKNKVQSALESMPATMTWPEMSKYWSQLNKLEVYRLKREIIEIKIQMEEVSESKFELKSRIIQLKNEVEVDEATLAKIDAVMEQIASLENLKEKFKNIESTVLAQIKIVESINSENNEELQQAVSDMWFTAEDLHIFREDMGYAMEDFWMSEPWRVIDEAFEKSHEQRFVSEMSNDIDQMEMELKSFDLLLNGLANIDNQAVQAAIGKLRELQGKALVKITEIRQIIGAENPEEQLDEMWQTMDRIGMAAEKHLQVILNYLAKNPQELNNLPAEVQELIQDIKREGLRGEEDNRGRMNEMYQGIDEKYIEELTNRIRAEVTEEVMRRVNSELMTRLAPYIGEKAVSEALNNIDVFGERGSRLLESTATILEEISDIDETGLNANLRQLYTQTKSSLVVDSMKEQLAEKWGAIKVAMEEGNNAEVNRLSSEIQELLKQNEIRSVKGDEAYQFADVKIRDNDWYFNSVMSMREQGVVSGYKDNNGNLTGEFKPENNVTMAEALKMSLEAAGHHGTPQDGAHWAISAGYLKKAEELGLGMINIYDLDRAATREDVAVIIAVSFGLNSNVEYEGVFSDYFGKFGNYIQAVYDAGIFTGEGGSDKFNGGNFINRAAMSKVINFAIQATDADKLIEQL